MQQEIIGLNNLKRNKLNYLYFNTKIVELCIDFKAIGDWCKWE